ncbi:MAG: hypothetical protein HOM15_08590 [Gammaproteobacteria bacterium]|nr:hypothetical protein [Gammaproteobacteria bacterium]
MQTLLANYRQQINQYYLADELRLVKEVLLTITDYSAMASHRLAHSLVTAIRDNKDQQSLVEAFLHEYQLNSDKGIVLMEIAEALLRIPDTHTQDLFLQEKLSTVDWHKHLQHSDSLLVNFATRTLDFTGKIEQQFKLTGRASLSVFSELSARVGLPVIRAVVSQAMQQLVSQAMQQLAYQFVIGETITKALHQASLRNDYLFSFDMLGEAALTANDTDRYFNAYAQAIDVLAARRLSKNRDPTTEKFLLAIFPEHFR